LWREQPFLLRRTKQEVAQELPDRAEEDWLSDGDEGAQGTLYRAGSKAAPRMLLK
jgi:SNF2 family DNA or RNA helicase